MPTKPRRELYREALLEVKVDQGTLCDIGQKELDALSTLPGRNRGPFVSQSQATKEVVDHNRTIRKQLSSEP